MDPMIPFSFSLLRGVGPPRHWVIAAGKTEAPPAGMCDGWFGLGAACGIIVVEKMEPPVNDGKFGLGKACGVIAAGKPEPPPAPAAVMYDEKFGKACGVMA